MGEELVGGVHQGVVEVVARGAGLNLVFAQVSQRLGVYLAQSGGEHHALALCDIKLEVTGNVKVFGTAVAALHFLIILEVAIPIGLEVELVFNVQLHVKLGIAGIHAGCYAVLYFAIAAVGTVVLMGELSYASKCEERLQAQRGFAVCLHQGVADNESVLKMLEHDLTLQKDAAHAIDGGGHLLAVELADVLVATGGEVTALVLVKAQIELCSVLNHGSVKRRQQHVVLVVQFRNGHYQ